MVDSSSGKIIKAIPNMSGWLDNYRGKIVFGNANKNWYDFLSFLDHQGQVRNNILNLNKNDSKHQKISSILKNENFHFGNFAISNKLMAIQIIEGAWLGSRKTAILQGFPEVYQSKVFDFMGDLAVRDSNVLISYGIPHASKLRLRDEKGYVDQILIQTKKNQIFIKAFIFWEREYFRNREAFGAIGEKGLFSAAEGNLAFLPFKDLPERYEIKQSICEK